MAEPLANVQRICGSEAAFAALLEGGAVVTWGEYRGGVNSTSGVRDQLRQVQELYATERAFAAILEGGRLVTWGPEEYGGRVRSKVCGELLNVQQMATTGAAFAALLADGTVEAWGNSHAGGDCSGVRHQLQNVQQVCATKFAFAAVTEDGPLVTWGPRIFGGDISRAGREPPPNLVDKMNPKRVDGSYTLIGIISIGSMTQFLGFIWSPRKVAQIFATDGAFTALGEGDVMAWGHPSEGGDISKVWDEIHEL